MENARDNATPSNPACQKTWCNGHLRNNETPTPARLPPAMMTWLSAAALLMPASKCFSLICVSGSAVRVCFS